MITVRVGREFQLQLLLTLASVLYFPMVCRAFVHQAPSSSDTASSAMKMRIDRSDFLHSVLSTNAAAWFLASSTAIAPLPTLAIDFVPSSPYFSGSYADAIEILNTQRIACDNIVQVISDGNLEEAGFKVMQLNAQTRVAGKIVLDNLQQNQGPMRRTSSDAIAQNESSINILRFLKCQKTFSQLLDMCEECELQVANALRGKLGAPAPAQLKLSALLDETRNAYDDFIMELLSLETASSRPPV
mmetsp:Transcript_12981/g.18910  ORF Transcript_12981/g.18910 Transcript_12981/m.18910 type:complete len:244 (-) Transcript_12981:223-954(-)